MTDEQIIDAIASLVLGAAMMVFVYDYKQSKNRKRNEMETGK